MFSPTNKKNAHLSEYFVTTGIGGDMVPVSPSGHPVKPCERSLSQVLDLGFAAEVTDRFPIKDHEGSPFPSGVALFCFPNGLKLTKNPPTPRYFTFVSTSGVGQRLYGCCITFYEKLLPRHCNQVRKIMAGLTGKPLDEDGEEEEDGELDGQHDKIQGERLPAVYQEAQGAAPIKNEDAEHKEDCLCSGVFEPKCICILSQWPFITEYRKYLTQLYRLSLMPLPAPMERYICNFMLEVPCPPQGRAQIQYSIGDITLTVQRPPANNPLQLSPLPFEVGFQCLDLENILVLFTCLLLEKQVLMYSSQLSALGATAEVLCSLLYPLSFAHVYIPVVPLSLIGVLNAPMPFLVGVHSSFMETSAWTEIPDSVVRVNLDRNEILIPEDLYIPALPGKSKAKLLKILSENANVFAARGEKWQELVLPELDSAFPNAVRPCDVEEGEGSIRPDSYNWLAVREAFLRFFISMLKDYRKHLIFPTKANPSPPQFINVQEFLKTFDEDDYDFMKQLFATQAFQNFIDDRIHQDPNDYDVLFFDESIESKQNRSKLRLNKRETPFLDSHDFDSTKTVVAPHLNLANLNKSSYYYPRFPKLDESNFIEPRPIPPLLSKTDLKPKLREHNLNVLAAEESEAENESFPATVYCTFFLTFCSSIGFVTAASDSAIERESPMASEKTKSSGRLERTPIASSGSLGMITDSRPETGDQAWNSAIASPALSSSSESNPLTSRDVSDAAGDGPGGAEPVLSMAEDPNFVTSAHGTDKSSSPVNDQEGVAAEDIPFDISEMTSVVSKPPSLPVVTDEVGETQSKVAVTQIATPVTADDNSAVIMDQTSESPECGKGGSPLKKPLPAIEVGSVFGAREEHGRASPLKKSVSAREKELASDRAKGEKDLALRGSGLSLTIPASSENSISAFFSRQAASFRRRSKDSKQELKQLTSQNLLNVAFEVLSRMAEEHVQPQELVYRSLIDACGRAGNTERAMKVLEAMYSAGIQPDSAVYSCLIRAFAMNGDINASLPLTMNWNAQTESMRSGRTGGSSDIEGSSRSFSIIERISKAVSHRREKVDSFRSYGGGGGRYSLPSLSFFGSSSSSPERGDSPSRLPKEAPKERRESLRNGRRSDVFYDKRGARLSTSQLLQLQMGDFMLKQLFPDLSINVERETCPNCEKSLTAIHIKDGWTCNPNDYTTSCPHCRTTDQSQRFVARFSVFSSSDSWMGSTGPRSPLYCEFLSPWVLKKEVQTIIVTDGAKAVCSPSFVQKSPTIFWNLIWYFQAFELPLAFLLMEAVNGATGGLSPSPSHKMFFSS